MIYTVEGGFTAEEIAKHTGGILTGSMAVPAGQLTLDSRDKNSGGLFVAIRGERFDGNDFIAEAVKNGAACCLTSRRGPAEPGTASVFTEDTTAALGALANAHRRRMNPVAAAVTGSVGKTTTKQFIYFVLSEKYGTHKTEGNFNNEIGLPLTLLQLTRMHGAAVLEFGMSGRGEISRLSRIAEPDIAVITNIGTSHIGYLGSRENIRDAKMEITDGLRPGGRLFLNGDEPLLAGVPGAVYTAFENTRADIMICEEKTAPDGSRFGLNAFGAGIRDIEIPAAGKHNIYNAAVAFGVGLALGLGEDEIRRGLLKFKNTGMRQNIYQADGMTVIEDCYNAAPESMASSLAVLGSLSRHSGGRSAAVLGDMRELGPWSETLHAGVGKLAAQAGVGLLFTFGREAAMIAEGAVKAGMDPDAVYRFDEISDPLPLAAALKDMLREGDSILFKASRAVQLERVVSAVFGR